MQGQSRFGSYERRPAPRSPRRWWLRLLCLALVLAAGALLANRLHDSGMKFELGAEALTVTAPDKTVTAVSYADITGVSLYTSPDYGTCASGTQRAGCWYGTWRNGQWQTYRLCVHPKVNSCVTVETIDGVLAFNAPSDSETRSLTASIDSLLAEAALHG